MDSSQELAASARASSARARFGSAFLARLASFRACASGLVIARASISARSRSPASIADSATTARAFACWSGSVIVSASRSRGHR